VTEAEIQRTTWNISLALLEAETLEDALTRGLEVVVETLNSEAGAVWLLDQSKTRLTPVFHMGPTDISNISVEAGTGIEGLVTESGKPVLIQDTEKDPLFDGSVFEEDGFRVRTMICVPVAWKDAIIGCVQIVNRRDQTLYSDADLLLCSRMAALIAMIIDEKGLIVDLEEKKKVLAVLKNVTKDFSSGEDVLHVLKGINLEIYQEEFIVVLGESGCGKTTMMNIIGGMDSMTSGQLLVEGKDFSHPSDQELTAYRRRYIGFIFQNYHLMPNLTALENVQFAAELVDHPMAAAEAIEKVGLTNRAGNYPGQLSGGQQQRVSIARAIVKNPKLILADEPTAALDYATSIEVLSVIEKIVKTQKTTVMMVTHNPEIAKMANRVVKVRNGRIASIKRNLRPLHAEELVW